MDPNKDHDESHECMKKTRTKRTMKIVAYSVVNLYIETVHHEIYVLHAAQYLLIPIARLSNLHQLFDDFIKVSAGYVLI
jgi:hypothetical protein